MVLRLIFGLLLIAVGMLLFIPFGIELRYSNGVSVRLRWLFVKLELYPQKEKKERPKPPKWVLRLKAELKAELKAFWHSVKRLLNRKKKKKAPSAAKKPQKTLWQQLSQERGVLGAIDFLKSIIACVTGSLSKIAAAARLEKLDVELLIVGDEPDQTAQSFGYVSAAVYPLAAMVGGLFKSSDMRINIKPQFVCGESDARVDLRLCVSLSSVLAAVISELWSFIKGEIRQKAESDIAAAKI